MGTQLPSPKWDRAPQYSTHFYCGQTAGWIKILLGTEVGLGPGDIVLDGDPAPPPKKMGHSRTAPEFSAHVYCDQTAVCIRIPLATDVDLSLGDIVLDAEPAPPPPNGDSPQFSAHVRCGQTAGWTKMPLRMHAGRPRPRRLCVRWDPAPRPPENRGPPPPTQFSAHV